MRLYVRDLGGTPVIKDLVIGGARQIISAIKTDTFSSAVNGTWTDITGVAVAITPQLSTSTIYLLGMVGSIANSSTPYVGLRLVNGATVLLQGDAAGSRTRSGLSLWGPTGNNLASPPLLIASHTPASVAAQTYQMQFFAASGTTFVNRDGTDTDTSAFHRTAAMLMAIEVG